MKVLVYIETKEGAPVPGSLELLTAAKELGETVAVAVEDKAAAEKAAAYGAKVTVLKTGEASEDAVLREVKEETGLFIIPEKAVGLGEILEVRKDIFDDTKKFICHSLFYYCEETGEETPIHLTKSEIAKGYYLKWATPQEIYDTNIAMEKDPWIIRDTAFIKMILDGKIAALQGIVTGTRYE